MTIQLLFGDKIRSEVLKILSGECFYIRRPYLPRLYILSPWISDVDIEFSDLYILKEKEKVVKEEKIESFLFLDYNIKSINLPYALLLLKLHGGTEVNIVTLPPNKMNLDPDYLPKVKALLDFLDEIGCNMFVNSKLHSKLLLANDLALLGSFNLSSSALYYREEIGVSINDLDNLESLTSYCWKVISESQLYGHSSLLRRGRIWDEMKAHTPRITRGWLLDGMIKSAFNIEEGRERYGEFFDVTGGYDKFIKSYAHDLNLFYLMNLRRLISSTEPWIEGKNWVKRVFDYKGDSSPDSIMEFLNSKFARKTVPDIKLRIKSLG